MLDEYKQLYKEKADLIKDWKKLTKSQLCEKYLDLKDTNSDLADSYLSAIIYSFWNVAVHNYYSQQVKEATELDCYNNLVDSILYALNSHVWLNENNSLYKDEKGPEKAINVVISSRKLNILGYNNMFKRRINKDSISLEYLQEQPYYISSFGVHDNCDDDYIESIIIDAFNRKEYFKAFMIDAIVYCDVFDVENDNFIFSEKKLRKHLRHLEDSNYYIVFSNTYNIKNIELVKRAISYIISLNQDKMSDNINYIFRQLRNNKMFIKFLKEK